MQALATSPKSSFALNYTELDGNKEREESRKKFLTYQITRNLNRLYFDDLLLYVLLDVNVLFLFTIHSRDHQVGDNVLYSYCVGPRSGCKSEDAEVAGGSCDLLHDDAIRVFALGFVGLINNKKDDRLSGTYTCKSKSPFFSGIPFAISFLAICGVQKNTLFSFQYFSRLPDEKVVPVIVTVSFSVNPTILWHA